MQPLLQKTSNVSLADEFAAEMLMQSENGTLKTFKKDAR
jgi:hypothetical protein